MITTISLLFFAIAVFTAIIAGGFGGAYLQKQADYVKSLELKINELETLVQKTPIRNPMKTNDGLEDAMAITIDQLFKAKQTLEYIEGRNGDVLSILQTIRSTPQKYDSDQPNRKI
jgi:outer membrane murein-binding lipoprotein Lpp